MKNKQIKWATIICCSLLFVADAQSFEIPSYIEDPQDVSGNINIIIEQNTPKRGSSEDAQDLTKKTQETISEYAARLYAEALAIRASMSKETGAVEVVKDVAGNILGSTNKQAILQNDVKSQVKNIALHLKQIVELETAIVNLQSTQLLAGMDEVSTSDSGSEEEDQ